MGILITSLLLYKLVNLEFLLTFRFMSLHINLRFVFLMSVPGSNFNSVNI